MKEKEEGAIKFSEKLSLKFRKMIIVSKLLTFIVVILLISAFVGLNVWVDKLELQDYDVTANKIYTLSEASKKALESVNQDVKLYLFGISEDDSVVSLVKQYCDTNSKITYEMLSSDTNLEKVQEFELEDGYSIVVVESGDSHKLIDAKSEFVTYDYKTYAEVDITEQTLTNSILGMTQENKPKVYFATGHGEFNISTEEGSQAKLGVLSTYLNNEAYDIKSVDLKTTSGVPEDCNVLAIVSPETDFLENETQYVLDYINKGGNLFITKDILSAENSALPNLQKILDVYGVTIENGYVLETDSSSAIPNYPYIFKPQLSSSSEITSDIYSDSYLLLVQSQGLKILPEEELDKINVTSEELMWTSDSAYFITDLSANIQNAAQTAKSGKTVIAAKFVKTIQAGTTDEETGETTGAIESKLIVSGNGRFFADYVIPEVSEQYPISYVGANKDFAINAISDLAEKEYGLTLRKDMAGTSYVFTASAVQNRVVIGIVIAVPVFIIIIGIIVGRHRKKRK